LVYLYSITLLQFFYDYLNEMQGAPRQGLVESTQQNKLWQCALVHDIKGQLPRAFTT